MVLCQCMYNINVCLIILLLLNVKHKTATFGLNMSATYHKYAFYRIKLLVFYHKKVVLYVFMRINSLELRSTNALSKSVFSFIFVWLLLLWIYRKIIFNFHWPCIVFSCQEIPTENTALSDFRHSKLLILGS